MDSGSPKNLCIRRRKSGPALAKGGIVVCTISGRAAKAECGLIHLERRMRKKLPCKVGGVLRRDPEKSASGSKSHIPT